MRAFLRQGDIVRVGNRESRRHAVVISGDAMNSTDMYMIAPLVSPRQEPYPFEIAIGDGSLMTIIGMRPEVGRSLSPTGDRVDHEQVTALLDALRDVCHL